MKRATVERTVSDTVFIVICVDSNVSEHFGREFIPHWTLNNCIRDVFEVPTLHRKFPAPSNAHKYASAACGHCDICTC